LNDLKSNKFLMNDYCKYLMILRVLILLRFLLHVKEESCYVTYVKSMRMHQLFQNQLNHYLLQIYRSCI